jgi:hypothetical protein
MDSTLGRSGIIIRGTVIRDKSGMTVEPESGSERILSNYLPWGSETLRSLLRRVFNISGQKNRGQENRLEGESPLL